MTIINISIPHLMEFFQLELEIFKENEMNAEKAHEFYDRVVSCQLNFATQHKNLGEQYPDHLLVTGYVSFQNGLDAKEYVDRKFIPLQKYLRKFFEPVEKLSSTELEVNYDSSGENDQSATFVNFNSLLQKQELYIQMIDSLVPEGEISSKKAELQFEHVSQLYERFMSNQSEIMTVVKDAAFGDQVEISKEVQSKVLSLQETLKEIFSQASMKLTVLPESKVNEHFNRTDRPNVICDFLESQYKKQKSLIEQIELIESKNDPNAAEAETLHNHISQIYDSFLKNQAKIETYVKGTALDKELEISRELLVKVMSLQTKLKEIFAPVQSGIDESKQMKESDKVVYLKSLLEKQKSLINEIDSMFLYQRLGTRYYNGGQHHRPTSDQKEKVKSLSPWLSTLEKWFFKNQTKIEELVDDLDLHEQKKISTQIQEKLTMIQNQYGFFLESSRCSYACRSCSRC